MTRQLKLHEEKGSKRYFVTGRGGDYLKDKDLVLDPENNIVKFATMEFL